MYGSICIMDDNYMMSPRKGLKKVHDETEIVIFQNYVFNNKISAIKPAATINNI